MMLWGFLWLFVPLAVPASGASEVVIGNVRVQALSSNLLRVEPRGPQGFEDRNTLMVANRHFGGLNIRQEDSAEGKNLITDFYTILLRNYAEATGVVRSNNVSEHQIVNVNGEQATESSCGGTQQADVTGAVRSDKFKDGAYAGNAGGCCDLCKSDPSCVAYVFVGGWGRCYPLSGYSGTTYSNSRQFGSVDGDGQGPSFRVTSPSGDMLFDTRHNSRHNLLHWPSPLSDKAYALMDKPRFSVPAWGVAPIPAGAAVDPSLLNSNGYDWGNQVTGDTYLFVLGSDLDSYNAARKDFIKLCGPTPVLPDYAYGTWFTFWNGYSESEAKDDINHWETLNLPLDIWGLDINWRNVVWPHTDVPYQCDYDHPESWIGNEWFQWLKSHNLRTYFNDHPCAQAAQTNPTEVNYRWNGLTKWLNKGLTFWWYDVNWVWSISPPFHGKVSFGDWEGLDTPAWGSHVYWTVTKYWLENVKKNDDWYGKPLALSKSFGPNWTPGKPASDGAEHPSHHRYPVHWTGDYVSIQASVESMVDAGIHSFKPYVHSDCGGDYHQKADDPADVTSAAGLLRWTGHCAYGSILRFHGADHRVWHYDGATQSAFRNYLTARHKLVPTIKAAAQRATETGHPLVARLDLFWPQHKESASNWQYLFLDDILVAPIFRSRDTQRSVWIPPGDWQDAWDPSVVLTGPKTVTANQPPERVPMWHRRDGGLLVLAHKTTTRIQTQDWTSLSIEAFPCSRSCRSSRKLSEAAGTTDVELLTDENGTISVHIGVSPVARAWVVRLNLRPTERLIGAVVDGVELQSVSQLYLEPDDTEYFPLMGAGAKPATGAGLVAELHLPAGSGVRSVQARVARRTEVSMLV